MLVPALLCRIWDSRLSYFGHAGGCATMTEPTATEPTLETSDLRLRAQDAIATKQHDVLLDLSPRLRIDREYWAGWFAPECAVAARASGRDDARAFLDEAISGGFAQYELFPELVAMFSVDADWSDLVARMEANVPPPPLEILD